MSKTNPLDGFTIEPATISYAGVDLQRPECILAERDGSIWTADARGGVVHVRPDGTQTYIGQRADTRFASAADANAADFESKFTEGTLPNGLAFAANGDILISNFGTDRLEVMSRDGGTRVMYDRIDGQPIGKVNFVLRDSKNRIWITVSTRHNPWTDAAAKRVRDGYIAVVDEHGLRIVADGFHFTNEVRLDAKEEWLYISETTGPHISRMRLDESQPGGVRLVDREVFGPSDLGAYPDGITFDAYGNLWIAMVMVDQILALTPEGDVHVLLDDGNPEASANLRTRIANGSVRAEDMQRAYGKIAPWMTSITFGGPDLRTAYIGTLLGNRVPYFRSPVAGLPMAHW